MNKIIITIVAIALVDLSTAQCPFYCSCAQASSTVDCRPSTSFKYSSIPDDAPVTTRVLIMTGNNLTEIIAGNFTRYSQLEQLYLDDNLLTEIDTDYFSGGLEQLTLLSLDGNPVQNVSDGAFSNLTSLQNLTIRDTPLSTIQADAFIGLSNLQYLSLDGSRVTELPVDIFTHIGVTPLVSVRRTQLTHLPDGVFSTVDSSLFNIDLSGNSWECDCMSTSLRDYLTTDSNILVTDVICAWPLESRGISITSAVEGNVTFTCYAPVILSHPQNVSVLTGDSVTITCNITALPRPEVIWLRNNETVEYDHRLQLLEDGSLYISDVMLSDDGLYQCVATNMNGSVESDYGVFTVAEATCFDGVTSSHETDVDCGGEFCLPCNISQRCANHSDCQGDLICLYTYQLPSLLDYISRTAPLAYTCNTAEYASLLLQDRITAAAPEVLGQDVTFDGNISDVKEQLRQQIAAKLEITASTIMGTDIVTLARLQKPLIQVYFTIDRSTAGDAIVSQLREQIHNGELGGTLKITDSPSQYNIRINI